jgi:uncharacterized protein involved in oxidation of intracellular sulfur
MNNLIIINEQPYGSEKPYNALRLAMQLQKDFTDGKVWIFLMADAADCAVKNQKTKDGYYNLERMIKSVLNYGGEVKICGSCADARGISAETIIEGTKLSTMAELTKWFMEADKVVSF